MNRDDIFLWSDGFWCFRREFEPEWVGGYRYRVIEAESDEWRQRFKMPRRRLADHIPAG